MNYRSKAVLETLIRVKGFSTQAGLPTNARATSLFTQVGSMIATMEASGTDQAAGQGNARIGTERKQELATDLRTMVREINRTAKGLDDETHPNAGAQFVMPRSQSYQALLATARAFLEHATPIKADLVASGLAGDFDETLTTLIADFTAATQKRESGVGEQVQGTAGLGVNGRNGVRLLQKLNATMTNLLKTDPTLMANWKRTVHIPRTPQRVDAETAAMAASAPVGSEGAVPSTGS